MDKVLRTFVCKKCGHQESAWFYDESDEWWLERMGGGFMESNAAKYREMSNATCKKCGNYGFECDTS